MRTLPFCLLTLAVAAASLGTAAERPNVLLICIDDLKPLLGCYGDDVVQTPNIDRLAERGMRFDRAYCNQAVCAPSRNSLLTGLRPQTLGIYDLATNFRHARPDAVTLPQHFKQHGYRVEGLGKIFHVGHGNHDDGASWSVPHRNAEVIKYVLAANRAPQGLTREEARFANAEGKPAEQLPRGAAYESADVPDTAYSDGALADMAVRRLQAAAERPLGPFFLAVGFVKPHLPFCAPQKYWDLYNPASFDPPSRQTPPAGAPPFAPTTWGELRQYAGIPQEGPLPEEIQRKLIHGYHAATSYMDAQVGRVLNALDEADLAQNTIIVFWGDHGWHLGDHGQWCKHSNYEQTTRIPLLVVAPGVTRQRDATGALVESVDVYPTLCELAGLPTPAGLDGASFAANLSDPAASAPNAALHYYPRGKRLGRAVRTDRNRLVEWKEPGAPDNSAILELYDYQVDPEETKNVAAEQPEVVAELRLLIAAQGEAKPQINVTPAERQAIAQQSRAERQASAQGR